MKKKSKLQKSTKIYDILYNFVCNSIDNRVLFVI